MDRRREVAHHLGRVALGVDRDEDLADVDAALGERSAASGVPREIGGADVGAEAVAEVDEGRLGDRLGVGDRGARRRRSARRGRRSPPSRPRPCARGSRRRGRRRRVAHHHAAADGEATSTTAAATSAKTGSSAAILLLVRGPPRFWHAAGDGHKPAGGGRGQIPLSAVAGRRRGRFQPTAGRCKSFPRSETDQSPRNPQTRCRCPGGRPVARRFKCNCRFKGYLSLSLAGFAPLNGLTMDCPGPRLAGWPRPPSPASGRAARGAGQRGGDAGADRRASRRGCRWRAGRAAARAGRRTRAPATS